MTPNEVVRNIYKSEETLKELQFYCLKNDCLLKLNSDKEWVFVKNEAHDIDDEIKNYL